MGLKVTIDPLGNPLGSSFTTELNNNLDMLADEFDNVVYRDGSLSMSGNLNMNSKRLFNLPLPVGITEPVRLADVMNLVDEITGSEFSTSMKNFSTRTEMASALALPGTSAVLTEAGREGIFILSTNDYSTNVTNDPAQAVYVPVAGDLTGATGAWVRQFSGLVNAKWFGALGNGIADDTIPIQQALNSYKFVHISAGTYVVSTLSVPANTTIATEGNNTIIKQKNGTGADTPIILVDASNIRIGSMKIVGNLNGGGGIDTTGEQNHGILIKATAVTGNLSNIEIGNIVGQNIRGDVFVTYSTDGATISRVRVGHLYGTNIYRCVAAVCTGTDIEIAGVDGTQIGFLVFDAEPDGSCAPLIGCRVGVIKGRNAGVLGTDATRHIDGMEIGMLDLDLAHGGGAGSTPAYPFADTTHAFQFRNCKSLTIGKFKANGFNGQVVKNIFNVGEVAKQHIHIGSFEWTDCAKTEAVYLAYCLGAGGTTRLTYDSGYASFTRSGGSIFRDCDGLEGGPTDLAIGADTIFLYVTDDAVVGPIYTSTSTTGRLTQSCSRTKLIIGAANVDYIGINSDDLLIEGGAVTAVTPFSGAAEETAPMCINTRINGVEYLFGVYGKINAIRAGHLDLTTAGGEYRVNGTKVVGARQAAVADAAALTSADGTNAAAAPTQAEFNALVAEFNKLRTDAGAIRTQLNTALATLRTHGLIAP